MICIYVLNRFYNASPTSSDLHTNNGEISVSTIAAVIYVAIPMLVITLIYSKILYIAITSKRKRFDMEASISTYCFLIPMIVDGIDVTSIVFASPSP
jgi:hypothetical protein